MKQVKDVVGANPYEDSGLQLARPENREWHEVGPRQRPSVTRSSGFIAEDSPITNIFGGKLRSELRIPGAKNSVTLEPYQSLQLDIASPQVKSITDALKGLTKSEVLHGEFSSPRGAGATATKQVLIETLPPVLILHLKRFQYDNAGGTQKIWKTIDYPLDLDIPKEVFPAHKRSRLSTASTRYQLIGVIYHHGKSASGGHYTVDVRRQGGHEWIRFDDTVIDRIRDHEVAVGGPEQNRHLLEAALHKHNREHLENEDSSAPEHESHMEKGWSRVNGISSQASSKLAATAQQNGSVTPNHSSGKGTPLGRTPARDSKVAYLLFYHRLGTAVPLLAS